MWNLEILKNYNYQIGGRREGSGYIKIGYNKIYFHIF